MRCHPNLTVQIVEVVFNRHGVERTNAAHGDRTRENDACCKDRTTSKLFLDRNAMPFSDMVLAAQATSRRRASRRLRITPTRLVNTPASHGGTFAVEDEKLQGENSKRFAWPVIDDFPRSCSRAVSDEGRKGQRATTAARRHGRCCQRSVVAVKLSFSPATRWPVVTSNKGAWFPAFCLAKTMPFPWKTEPCRMCSTRLGCAVRALNVLGRSLKTHLDGLSQRMGKKIAHA